MDNHLLDVGLVQSLRGESFGEPGQRTFRIRAETGAGTVSLWLEKEQLVVAGSAITEVLERVPDGLGEEPTSEGQRQFVGELDVRVGSLAIGFDAALGGFTLEAGDFVSAFELSSIALLARRSDFARLAEDISGIVSQSRPRCPLCGRVLTGAPHFCPPSNGHAHLEEPH